MENVSHKIADSNVNAKKVLLEHVVKKVSKYIFFQAIKKKKISFSIFSMFQKYKFMISEDLTINKETLIHYLINN